MALNQSIPEAHELWFAALGAAGRSSKTVDLYRYSTGQLVEWRSNADLLTVSRFEALAFTKNLNERFTPGGVASRLKGLKAFFNWAIAEELCDTNPFARITINVPADPRPTADEAQIERMLAHAKSNKRDHALLTVLVDTGCRKGELAAVTRENVDLKSGTITFPVSKSRPRTVPLTDRAVVALGRWLRTPARKTESLWAVSDPYSLVKAAVRRHSKGQLTPHCMRRAFAVRWLTKGGSETGLMRVCGWSSREMITLYTRASADVLASVEFKRLMA